MSIAPKPAVIMGGATGCLALPVKSGEIAVRGDIKFPCCYDNIIIIIKNSPPTSQIMHLPSANEVIFI